MFKLNTAVRYHRPQHCNRYGHYISKTKFRRANTNYQVLIELVWFNGAGWYFSVEFLGFKIPWTEDRAVARRSQIWPKGPQVAECSFAAEKAARALCRKYGVRPPNLEPYVLYRPR